VLNAPMSAKLLPGPADATIATVEVFGEVRRSAEAGECIGVTLAEAVESPEGMVLCAPGSLPDVSDRLSGWLFWLSNDPLLVEESLHVRIVTQDIPVRVEGITRHAATAGADARDDEERVDQLAYGQIGRVSLKMASPLVREPFANANSLGTFTLLRSGDVVGAGTVIE
ncbi:hypothetical protein LCGC14_2279690, partial [marine sediment metagenome]